MSVLTEQEEELVRGAEDVSPSASDSSGYEPELCALVRSLVKRVEEGNEMRAAYVEEVERCGRAEEQRDAARAEVERLRDTVRHAQAVEALWHMSGDDRPTDGCDTCEKYAAALAAEPKGSAKDE